MKMENQGHTCVIKDNQHDLTAFLMKLTHEHKTFEKQNLIIDLLSHDGLAIKELNAFLPLSQAHRKGKRSFVLVADVDFNRVPDKLVLAPTVQEAHDLIEMEEIERDLGF